MNSKKLVLTLAVISFIIITPVFASVEPTIEWEKPVDASRPTRIYGQDLTSDGGLILTGQRLYGDSKNGVLIKVDSDGEKVWEKTIVTTENDYLTDVKQTSDGGYIAIGSQHSSEKLYDVWVVLTDSTGTVVWENTYGWTGQDYGNSILEDSNGDFVWTGSREHGDQNKVYYGKISPTGELLTQIFSLTPSIGYKIIESSDGGYVVVGTGVPQEIYGGQMMTIKLNATLSKQWTSYQGYAGDRVLLDVIEAKNGDFVSVGYTDINIVATPWILRVDSEGETVGLAHFNDYDSWSASNIVQLDDGGFVMSGRAYGEEFTCYMAGVDRDLELEWIHEFSDPEVELTGMIQNRADSLLFVGTLEGDIDMPAILKTGPVGDALGYITFSVKDKAGDPIIGASIVAMMKADVGLSGSTGQTGVLVCDEVTPGSYTVQVSAEGYETETIEVEAIAGEPSVVTVTLSEVEPEPLDESYVLTVNVQDIDGSSVRAVHLVSLSSPDGVEVEADTNTAGEAQVEVFPGDYEFKLSKTTYEMKTFEVSITGDEVVTVILNKEADETPESEDPETSDEVGESDEPEVPEPTETTETQEDDFSNLEVIEVEQGNNMLLYGGVATVALIGLAAYALKLKGVF